LKLNELFKFAVNEGIKVDPRGKKGVQKHLKKVKADYRKLSSAEKKFYDKDRLWNPYDDSRIYFGAKQDKVKTILAGIDMEVPEILLADRLREKGIKIDLVLAHHPEDIAYSGLYNVMSLQADSLANQGVPKNEAKRILEPRIEQVRRGVYPRNHTRAADAARLLNIPFANLHTVTDNHVQHYLQKKINARKPKTLKHLMLELLKEPEYAQAAKMRAGPTIFVGKPENKCGKIYVDMTGGTEGPEKLYEKLKAAKISTVVQMHASDKLWKAARKSNVNIVIAGHIASDNLGINLLLDKIEKKGGRLKVLECSGFKRVKRKK
jgi:putative NIF3 family GTP cyclohydrolase 1 type 2